MKTLLFLLASFSAGVYAEFLVSRINEKQLLACLAKTSQCTLNSTEQSRLFQRAVSE